MKSLFLVLLFVSAASSAMGTKGRGSPHAEPPPKPTGVPMNIHIGK